MVSGTLLKVRGRRFFDPTKPEDVAELKFFLEKSKWRNGCPFYLEESWEEIPAMCKDKYTRHILAQN